MEFLRRPSQEEIRYKSEYARELKKKFDNGALEELQPYKQWVVGRSEIRNGKKTKPPYNPRTGRLADPTNPEDWVYLPQALKALSSGNYHFLGFAFSRADPYTIIDIDDTVGLNGSIYYPGKGILARTDSYTETSISSRGLHVIVEGEIPHAVKTKQVEIYSYDRYASISLRQVRGTPKTIEMRQKELEAIYYRLRPQRLSPVTTAPQNATVVYGEGRSAPSYIQAIERGLRHDTDGLFGRLLKGDSSLWEGEEHVFASRSDADFYLARKLAYWTYGDAEQIDAVFRTPALYRPKWDEKRGRETYGQMTIRKALAKK